MGIRRNKIQLLILAFAMILSFCGCSMSVSNTNIDSAHIAESAFVEYASQHVEDFYIPEDAAYDFSESILTENGQGVSILKISSGTGVYLYRLSYQFDFQNNEVQDIEVIPYALY